jgi:hypothetical protein
MSVGEVVVFLGPSLPIGEARRCLKARYLPPARQGDVFRVLPSRPSVIVLIDGVFELQPSVWHHELRAALASGVAVIGAASMGALRAAELQAEGMRPIGRIAQEYLRGARTDDGDVALLHGDATAGYRALTVPLVNVEATVREARRRRLLSPAAARAVVALARSRPFKDRRWPAVVPGDWPLALRRGFLEWVKIGAVDQKAHDARAALKVAGTLRRRGPGRAHALALSSFVRRRRLMDVHAERLEALQAAPDAHLLAAQGLRRLLLASFAKVAGLTPSAAALKHALALVDGAGLSADEHLATAEVLALETLVLAAPERFVSDGPAWIEGLALEARLSGRWARPGPSREVRAPRRTPR